MTLTANAQDRLNDFDANHRRQAMEDLAPRTDEEATPRQPLHVNMHCHTFFSYNGYGASPSAIAWKARQDGWYAAGICDFDVLDAMDEFLTACDTFGVRGTANLETRVFFKEYADVWINSPGEPGVYYFMGAGFVTPPKPGTSAAAQLQAMRDGADSRNREVIERVNGYLAPLAIDYATEVLPLTPNGNATERHIVSAYYDKSRTEYPEESAWCAFWSAKLGVDAAAALHLLKHPMDFSDKARGKLMKAGGPGYVEPTPSSFPALDEVIAMIRDCQAIPTATWLDGTSPGEEDLEGQLDILMAKGIAAINIIPDRNWNLKPGDERDLKIRKFHECVAIADRRQLPVNVGTELNKYGQPWVDDFTAAPMRAVAASCIRGARIMVGHTRLLRYADFSYISDAAATEYSDTGARNDFFEAVGALPVPGLKLRRKLAEQTAGENLALLHDAARQGVWPA